MHKGMQAMFVMMNAARLGVGVQGLSQAEVAYQNALTYANDRLQGRSITGTKAPDKPADPIIVHPDIRRMLMTMKAFTEGSRALEIGRASCRERVCQYVEISVVAVSLKKQRQRTDSRDRKH